MHKSIHGKPPPQKESDGGFFMNELVEFRVLVYYNTGIPLLKKGDYYEVPNLS